jgi:TonB-dependent SusC/RagA subfamily outer membrane receptor
MMKLARVVRRFSRSLAFVVAAICLASVESRAQESTLSGRVTASAGGEPLAGARVLAIGTASSAVAGQDGRFTLKHLAPGSIDLQVLHVGYQAQKRRVAVSAGPNAGVDFSMVAAIVKLAEVVSTGAGEQRKVELGYATASLSDIGTRLERSATSLAISDVLVQRVPSVNVLGQGMVGAAASIRLRGLTSLSLTNEPIVLVDGVRMAADVLVPGSGVGGTKTSLLNSFTPDDVESIEILKGPAAASSYGTNAANGVIVITTKKGRVGSARWTWTGEQGRITDENDYPAAYAIWGHAPNSTTPIRCLLPTMSAATCVQDSVTSLNILKDKALTPLNTGRRGFAYSRLDSIKVPVRGEWKNPEALQRETIRANFNATLTQRLELGATAAFMKSDQRFPQSDNSPISLFAAARSSPGFAHSGLGYTNVGALGENLHGYNLWIPSEIFQDLNTQNVQRQTMTGNIGWRAQPWMQNDATVGVDYINFTDFSVCRLNECPAYAGLRNGASYSATTSARILTTRLSSLSTWAARPDVNVRTTVGTEWTYVESDLSAGTGVGLPPGAQNVGQAAVRTNAFSQAATAGKTLGLFAQTQASLRDRLFVTVGMRSDQNNSFGPNQRWAHYPKASVSWVLSDEAFFPRAAWLDQFRVRGAYGASGRQPGLTSAFKSYRPTIASLGGVDQRGLVGDQVGNPDLEPERSGELELGLDARVFKGRVNLELTYFDKKTTNAITLAPLAASASPASLAIPVNTGSVTNSGFEAVVTAQLVDRRAVAWDVTVGASHWTNTVDRIGAMGTLKLGNTWIAEGYPINALFFRPYSYADANNDGRIQATEVVVDTTMRFSGYQVPRDLVSIQSGLELFARRLRINALFDHKGGHNVFDASSAYLCQQFRSCPDESNPEASIADQARSVANRYGTTVAGRTYATAAGYLSNGRFWRLREVSANFALPDRITKRVMRADRASLTAGVRNLAVWTSYRGVDPESSFGAGDLQTDFMTAGPPRYYNLRINLHY